MEITIHKDINVLDEIIPSWDKLNEDFNEITIYHHLEYIKFWWDETHAKNNKIIPYIVEIKKKKETIGVIPLYRMQKKFTNINIRILRPIGLADANYLTPILSKKYCADEILQKAMQEIYKDKDGWDMIQWGDLPEGSSFDTFLTSYRLKNKRLVFRKKLFTSPRMFLDNELQTTMNRVNKRFLKNVLKSNRRLHREGDLVFHKVENIEEIEPILKQFFKFHIERWKNTSTPSRFENQEDRNNAVQYAYNMFIENILYLVYLTHNDNIIAISFGLASHNTSWFLVQALNKEYSKYSVGHQLVYYLLLNSHKDGYHNIEFLTGNEEYKQKWGSVNRYNLEYLVFNHSLKSLLYKMVHQTYYSKEFTTKPRIQQISMKSFIRGFALLLGIKDKFRPTD